VGNERRRALIGEDRDDLVESAHSVPRDAPLYCPRCDCAGDPGGTLCSVCGDSLVVQGYCATCERTWRLPIGAACPKHETALEDHPLESVRLRAPDSRWVTVRRFSDALKAEAPRIRLEAEGIPTFVEGARMGSNSMYPVATGGVKLQVPLSHLHEARVMLAQSWAPPDVEEDDDAWEELGPEPGAARRSIMRGAIVVILFGPILLGLVTWLLGG
jgi:hypothetical protein